tara:strand:+ start:717 stop:1592 length:876 start_codon:yes stop_codon:yes gene_type:complete
MPPIMKRKKYGYTVSTTQGFNKVTACAKAAWGTLKNGSFIAIDDDDVFYRVINKNKFLYAKNVEVIDGGNKLKINENIGSMLGSDDDLTFTNKEYKITTASISEGGAGYLEGDVLRVEGGVCKYNSLDEIDYPLKLTVTEVDENGSILALELTDGGLYYVTPESSCSTLSGSGSDAVVSLTSELLDVSTIEGRAIIMVELFDDHTIVYLNHALPPRMVSGEIKVEKWELTLDNEYTNENKVNVPYEVIKDFTPNYDLPLIYGNLSSSHLLYNEAMTLIDQKLKALEDRLGS